MFGCSGWVGQEGGIFVSEGRVGQVNVRVSSGLSCFPLRLECSFMIRPLLCKINKMTKLVKTKIIVCML